MRSNTATQPSPIAVPMAAPSNSKLETSLMWFLIALGAGGIFASTQPWVSEWVLRNDDDISPVAQVTPQTGTVRYRPKDSWVWRDVGVRGQGAAEGAAVFTAEDGWSSLIFTNHLKAQVKPNSLVVIGPRLSSGGGILHVESGVSRLELPAQKDSVSVAAGSRTFKVRTADAGQSALLDVAVNPSSPEDGVRLDNAAKTGIEVSINAQNSPDMKFVISPDQAATITKSGEIAFSPSLRAQFSPEDGETLVRRPGAGGQSLPFEFKVVAESQGQKLTPLSIELALAGAQKSPKSTLLPLANGAALLSTALSAGIYHWRVLYQGVDAKVYRSLWRSFTVQSLSAPQILGPKDLSAFLIPKNGEQRLALSWVALSAGMSTEVELKAEGENGPPHTYKTEWAGQEVSLKSGAYQWRARTLYEVHGRPREESDWSGWYHFQIRSSETASADLQANQNSLIAVDGRANAAMPTTAPIVAPVAKALPPKPAPKIEILPSLSAGSGSGSTKIGEDWDPNQVPIRLNWKPFPGVSQYQITIFNTQGGKVLQSMLRQTSFMVTVTSLEDSKLSYQVDATLPTGEKIQSAKVAIQLDIAPPAPKRPLNGATVNISSEFILTWEKTSLTKQYEVQVATDASFSQIRLAHKLPVNYWVADIKTPGTFFWRVRALGEKSSSRWSDVFKFTLR